jgi:anti-sigma factor RsiW
MKCKEIFDKLSDYIDKELDDHLCEEIESHVKDCEPCVAFINTLRKTVELFHTTAKDGTSSIPTPVSNNLMDFLKKELASEDEKKHE